MQEFLRIRASSKSDSDAAKAMGLLPATVYKWKSYNDPDVRAEYLAAYAKTITARERAITEIDRQLQDELRPAAFDRYRELVTRPITDRTSPTEMRVIKDAAKDVLEETGDLGSGTNRPNTLQLFFTQMNVDQSGRLLRPGWNETTFRELPDEDSSEP